MAIVLDGKVYSAPSIRERIGGGRASISGSFSTAEAQDLAIVLRAGSLPAPVSVLEERTVGPSLGQESIDSGVRAAMVGAVCVVVFMRDYLHSFDKEKNEAAGYWPCVSVVADRNNLNFNADLPKKIGLQWDNLMCLMCLSTVAARS